MNRFRSRRYGPIILKVRSGKEVCPVVSSLTLTVGRERESRRGAEAGVGVCVSVRL